MLFDIFAGVTSEVDHEENDCRELTYADYRDYFVIMSGDIIGLYKDWTLVLLIALAQFLVNLCTYSLAFRP